MVQDARSAIERVPFLKRLRDDQKDALAAVSQLVRYRRDETLFNEWKLAQHLYVIVSGTVLLTSAKAGHREIAALSTGDVCGWSAVVEPQRYSTATARAMLPTTVLVLEREALLELLEQDNALGFRIMKHVAQVLAERLSTVYVQFNMPDDSEPTELAS